jgi:hypothetical protein
LSSETGFFNVQFAAEQKKHFVVDGSRLSELHEFLALAIEQFFHQMSLNLIIVEEW